MIVTNIPETETMLPNLIQCVLDREEVIISKAGIPLVKIIKYKDKESIGLRRPGNWQGKVYIAEDFDELPFELVQT